MYYLLVSALFDFKKGEKQDDCSEVCKTWKFSKLEDQKVTITWFPGAKSTQN